MVNLHAYLYSIKSIANLVRGECMLFLNAIEVYLLDKHNKVLNIDSGSTSIICYIENNKKFYKLFLTGIAARISMYIKQLLLSRNCSIDIVNLIIQATLVALKIDIFIYQKNRDHLQILKCHFGQEGLFDVHLKLTCHPWFQIFIHYNAIVIFCKLEP